jgi:hypothetical protein
MMRMKRMKRMFQEQQQARHNSCQKIVPTLFFLKSTFTCFAWSK